MVRTTRLQRSLLIFLLTISLACRAWAADARFDLVGPKIDVKVTRGGETLPIAEVPNLQPGDKLWLHPDLPPTQSVKYLLICAFLRGSTNPPPDDWFVRVETWQKNVRQEGVFVTVPAEAQQVVLFLAPETGGDFTTLKSAVKGRPGIFVRASQDLAEAGFEQARIERYLADIRRVPPSDAADLQRHSDLLARTLALKPNPDCFKRPVDTQFTCLTQIGTQTLLDDGHGNNIVSSLSNGPNSDFINAASYTQVAGAGLYSAYVGAIVDLLRIMGSVHTAQFQYIPAIAFPQAEALNLKLNAPPSFHNPKSVIVIGLPAIQPAQAPPLRSADPNSTACLLQPLVTLPIEGAPLVFSTGFAHELVLHLNTPPGAPPLPDIPLVADAFQGGLVLQRNPPTRRELPERQPLTETKPVKIAPNAAAQKPAAPTPQKPVPEPILLTGAIHGRWGFDAFVGPQMHLQQLPGADWRPTAADGGSPEVIAGQSKFLLLTSTGSSCVHTIEATPPGSTTPIHLSFHNAGDPDHPNLLAVSLPEGQTLAPGDLHLEIQQYGQPRPDGLSARTFAEPAHLASLELRAGDRAMHLTGSALSTVERVQVGDLVFKPVPDPDAAEHHGLEAMRLALPEGSPAPPTKTGDHLNARVSLNDGRVLNLPLVVGSARPELRLLNKSIETASPAGGPITLGSQDDVPLSAHLTFTLKSRQSFPRTAQIEVETVDGTLRTVLTLAPGGGLVLQDPKTVVASLDALRSFGPSAFGALHVRAVYPPASSTSETNTLEGKGEDTSIRSDWLPLATLVRLPTLKEMQCPADAAQPCVVQGQNLFLIQAVSVDPTFGSSTPVPDGFTGTNLQVPHPTGSTLYLKLRDDPEPVDAAVVQTATAPGARSRSGREKNVSSTRAAVAPAPAEVSPATDSSTEAAAPTPAPHR